MAKRDPMLEADIVAHVDFQAAEVGCTSKDIAEALGYTTARVTRAALQLEKEGKLVGDTIRLRRKDDFGMWQLTYENRDRTGVKKVPGGSIVWYTPEQMADLKEGG